MLQRVYIETSFVGYLTSRPSRDVVFAAHQQITHDWWDNRRTAYELCVSQLVQQEAGAGDPTAARERLDVLETMTFLETLPTALDLAKELIRLGALPKKAADDAMHIAIAATHGVSYLLTWNCRHIANAAIRPLIESTCTKMGLKAPIICTPEELLESTQ